MKLFLSVLHWSQHWFSLRVDQFHHFYKSLPFLYCLLKIKINISSLELEKNLTPLQNQLSKTEKYISQQYKIANPVYSRGQSGAFVYTDDIQKIKNQYGKVTDDNLIAYYENFAKTQPLNFREKMFNILIAKRNISKAEIYQERQQESINILEEEYQTRFGGLSRYG